MKSRWLLVLWLAAVGCAGTQEDLANEKEFQDERANPYAFNLSLAYSMLDTQQPMEAGKLARRLMEMDREAAEPYYVLARAQLDMRQLDSAERMLREASRRDPKLAKAHSLYGTLLDVLGRPKDALAKHRRAIELQPDNAGFRNNLGFSYYLAEDYRSAIKAYEAALERDSSLRRVHNNLGFAHGKLGDMAKAAQEFSLAGPPAQVANNLGMLHEERGELEPAYAYFLNALQIDPQLVPARANLQRICTALERALPELPDPHTALARAHTEPVDAVYIEAEPPRAAPAAADKSVAPSETKP